MDTRTAQIAAQAREAGYRLERIEQVRGNRWLLTLKDHTDACVLAMVQQRPLVSAADVQDLGELLRLQRFDYGLLVALEGKFSPAAQRTAAELSTTQIILCAGFPPPPSSPQMKPLFESF